MVPVHHRHLDEAPGSALLMKQQAGMEHVEFTNQQVHAVTVWKVEADYLTASARKAPSRICTETRGGGAIIPGKKG